MRTIPRFLFRMNEITLNYRVIVERYPFMNGAASNSISNVKSSLYSTGIKAS